MEKDLKLVLQRSFVDAIIELCPNDEYEIQMAAYNKICDNHSVYSKNNCTMDDIREYTFLFKNDDFEPSHLATDSFYKYLVHYTTMLYIYNNHILYDITTPLSKYVIFSFKYSIQDILLFKRMMIYNGYGDKLRLVNDEYVQSVNDEILSSNILLKELMPIILQYVTYV
jgi:hypothetical protein